MKSQKGSIAAITLVFALLLLLAGGSWLMLMTVEQTASSSDETGQKAWYAAEAGLTRAVSQLKYNNANWDWLSTNDNFPDNSQTVMNDITSLPTTVITDKNGDWYAVSVTFVKDGVKRYLGASGVEKGDVVGFDITAVGSSRGTRKVIKKNMTITPEDPDDTEEYSEKPALPGVVQTGGNITVENTSNITGGNIYASSITDNTGGGLGNAANGGSYLYPIKTQVPAGFFSASSYSFDDAISKNWTTVLAADKKYYWDAGSQYQEWSTIDASAAGGTIIYVDNYAADSSINITFNGPATGKPVTLIFSSTNKIRLGGNYTGKVRIITNGDLNLTNAFGGSAGMYMIVSNGDVIIGDTPTKALQKTYVSSNKSIIIENSSGIVGQLLAKTSVTLKGPVTYDTSVMDDVNFKLPAGMY